ncbi:hypothetical protein Q75_13685 [Bacillus coahuilensis p1.1.43]|uniref:YdbS-like PH domain-containing protein n=2 Tax=Bacillus coahuilensis TaxID=408580 RepID=A0A147K5N1_9BACI|nr:hypothetical protein Q75_13685 [Bacillus coahuilensis p1.1.43]
MFERKKLHPISAVTNLLKSLKEIIIPFIVLVFFNAGSEKTAFWDYIPIGVMVLLPIIAFINGILKWWRFSYRIEEEELRIEYGVFIRKRRYIPIERIQSLNFSEGLLHRPFSLVKVKVETAGSSDPSEAEAELTAIRKEEAEELQTIIRQIKNKKRSEISESVGELDGVEAEYELKEEIVYQMSLKDLFLMGLTSGGVGVIFSGLAVFFSQGSEFIPYEYVYDQLEIFVSNGVVFVSVISFFALLFTWMLSVGATAIVYGNFTVKKLENEIIVTKGLIEKKQITIPQDRIQGIHIVQSPIRELLGFSTVKIVSAGGSVLDKDSVNINVLPFIKRNQIGSIMTQIVPGYELLESITPLPKRSKRKYIIRLLFLPILPMIGLTAAWFPYGALSFVGVPFLWWFALLQHRTAGVHVGTDQLTVQYRGVTKNRIVLKKNRIQVIEYSESWFQKRNNLATLLSTVKSSGASLVGKVRDLEGKTAHDVMEWFSPKQK